MLVSEGRAADMAKALKKMTGFAQTTGRDAVGALNRQVSRLDDDVETHASVMSQLQKASIALEEFRA